MKVRRAPERVLILETLASGHRLVYVRLLIEAALRKGMGVILATSSEVITDARFEVHLQEYGDQVSVLCIDEPPTVWSLQRMSGELACDLVVVPDLLKYGLRMLVGPTRPGPLVRMLVMNDPRWHLSKPSLATLARILKLLLLKAAGARCGVELLWLRGQGTPARRNVVVDPLIMDVGRAETLAASMRIKPHLGLDSGTFWFGIVGGLNAHKNVPLVVEALEQASNSTDVPLGLALLGPWANPGLEAEVMTRLTQVSFRVVQAHGHMTNQEMNVMVGALDCAVMAYSTSQPNSTTAKAAALGVKVVTAGTPRFRRGASRLTGRSGVVLESSALAEELLLAIDRPVPEMPRLTGPEGLTGPFLADLHHFGRWDARG